MIFKEGQDVSAYSSMSKCWRQAVIDRVLYDEKGERIYYVDFGFCITLIAESDDLIGEPIESISIRMILRQLKAGSYKRDDFKIVITNEYIFINENGKDIFSMELTNRFDVERIDNFQ
ncbi:MAG: hypothetical protein ACRC7N_22300 [Clostridium sp.]